MFTHSRLCLSVLAVALVVSACVGNSSAPSPQTAPLHIGVDVSTCYLIGSATISIDGTVVGVVTPGSAGLTQQVAIGGHTISGIGLTIDRSIQATRAPATIQVPTGGFNYTMYCTANRGYQAAPVR